MSDSIPFELRRVRSGRRQQAPSGIDIHLALPVLLLVAFGIVMVFSASYPKVLDDRMGDPFHYVKRQALFACFGALLCLITWRLRRDVLLRLAYPAYALSILLLVVVLIVGREINGARSWIPLGFFNLQPSEVAKVALMLALAKLLSDHPRSVASLRSMLPALGMIGLVCLLVLAGKDLGTVFVTGLAGLMLLFLAGGRVKHLLQVSVPVAMLGALAVCTEPYRLERIKSFLNPEAHLSTGGHQIARSLIAIGSGGLLGVGFSRSREKFVYLPEPYTDSIFAVIGEELGLAFCLAVLALFCWIGWRGFAIARQSNDRFSALTAAGMTNLIILGATTNLLVITGLVPPTGLPLIFISYGGSSLVFALIMIGILANLSRHLDQSGAGNPPDVPRSRGESASALGADIVARTLRPRGR